MFSLMKEEILEKVYKPGRYLGNEWNACHQAKSGALKFALCFPDLYEIGMSHLGFRIIYGLLNEKKDIVCERVFAPADDLEGLLRKENIPLASLESDTPLSEFDIIGFSLSHELLYTNVLNILELSRIPLYASERRDSHPLIIAGGYCCINPEPMADFFDCFLIGEAEEVILEVVECVRTLKAKGMDRCQLLRQLARISGVYVPSLYTIEHNQDGTIKSFLPQDGSLAVKIKKRIIQNLDTAFFPASWPVPYIQIIHDRAILEIMRGCPNNCRFCQARPVYYPFRIRSQEKIIELAQDLLKNSGYEEISLLGLSCGDHPKILDVLRQLIPICKDKGIGVSLPSLKIKDYLTDIPALLTSIKKTGLTFAPEAASARLRALLNKNIELEELFRIISNAYKLGYRHIKLYFMIGLPEEKMEDLDAIVELAVKVVSLRKDIDGKLGQVTLSISAFSPKPHTAFERSAMDTLENLRKKQTRILSNLRKNAKMQKVIKIDFHNFQMSLLETALSRADRRLANVIYNAFKAGGRFDSWGDKFNFEVWDKAFNAAGINLEFYANRQRHAYEILPWAHIDVAASG